MTVLKKCVKQAITGISGGFIWDATEQGQEYWDEVIKHLEELLEEEQ